MHFPEGYFWTCYFFAENTPGLWAVCRRSSKVFTCTLRHQCVHTFSSKLKHVMSSHRPLPSHARFITTSVSNFQRHPLAYESKACLDFKAQLKCHFFKEDLLMAHEIEGNLCIFSSHISCVYFFSNSFKCLFSWSILFGPLCLTWQVGLHFINEIITIYHIICIFV